ncbi:MAG: hypothetical protein AAGF35_16280 [Pseudomonadota bacterium]
MFRSFVISFLLLIHAPAFAQTEGFPDMIGVWTGSYNVAFPEDHSHFSSEIKGVQMELHITRQDGNLFWAQNRWSLDGHTDWHVENGTGTFDLLDRSALSIVETTPDPEYGSTGYFVGKLVDGKLYLSYLGSGRGISFATVLERK